MKIFVINPGSTSTKIALFIDEKPVWVAGAHHTADDLSEFHHVNEQYEYRKNFYTATACRGGYSVGF